MNHFGFATNRLVVGERENRRLLPLVITLVAVFALLAAACGNDDGGPAAEPVGDGSLGVVSVSEGEAIQIRSLNAIAGDVAFLGVPNQRGVELAIEDYGAIKGFPVDLGAGLDDQCSADGGQAAAQQIVADEQVVGVIGTSCSGAATAAAPLVTNAGMVMISPSNTAPALTSDFQGTAGDNYSVGYYRTAHNDLVQGEAMARFVYQELGLTSAAAIHDGDPYTQGLAQAFTDSFEALGGTVTGFVGVGKEDSDMVPALTELATGSPQALFFPVFQPAGDFIAQQAPTVSGLESTVLLVADGLLVDGFMEQAHSEGIYFSGPDTRFGANLNQGTSRTAEQILATYQERYGESPTASFWGHSYDATTLLLDAIKSASWVDGDTLNIDRQAVRDYLFSVRGYSGVIGTINCDGFGDCGSQKVTVIHHESSSDLEAGKNNVVFEHARGAGG